MLASITTFSPDGQLITVEVDLRPGLPSFTVLGLPDRDSREIRASVAEALLRSKIDLPSQRLTINVAPASQRRPAPSLSFAIAIGVLAAKEIIPVDKAASAAFLGELAANGQTEAVGARAEFSAACRAAQLSRMIIVGPEADVSVVDGVKLVTTPTLDDLIAVFREG